MTKQAAWIAVGAILLAILSAGKTGTGTKEATVELEWFAGRTAELQARGVELARAGDKYGVQAMILRGDLTTLDPGTRITIEEERQSLIKIRIQGNPNPMWTNKGCLSSGK